MRQEMIGQDPLAEYLGHFERLIGDKRTSKTFGAIVRGIINAGSLICQRIAAHSPLLSATKDGAQRVIRLARGESTKRSDLDAEHLVEVLCERGVHAKVVSELREEGISCVIWITDTNTRRSPMKDCSTRVAESLAQMVREQAHEIVGQGTPASISEMEVTICQAVRQLAAQWVEIWLGEMGGALAPPEIPCTCGDQAVYTRLREGVLMTIFGRISFKRRYYLCSQCHQGQYPLDTELGYKPGEITPQLASMAGWVGAELPFQRGSELLEALCGITLSENTIREATQRIGDEVREQEAEWKAESQDVASLRKRDSLPQDGKPARLYGSLDGVLVPEGERWRELKIGSWYREARARDSTSSDQDTPPAIDITYYCDITEAEEFGQLLWATGYQRWADQAQELVFVADAAVWIWNLVSDYYPNAVQIVDWYHALEYITPIANVAFGENTAESKAWREQVTSDLWGGHFDQVLAAFQA